MADQILGDPMTNRLKIIAGVSAAAILALGAPTFAAAPQARAPSADVSALVSQIRSAIEATRSSFTPGEREADKEAAIQAAISAAIASSGFDAVTAQAALEAVASDNVRDHAFRAGRAGSPCNRDARRTTRGGFRLGGLDGRFLWLRRVHQAVAPEAR